MKLTIKADQLRVNPQALSKPQMKQFCVQELFNVQRRLRAAIASGKNAHGGAIRSSGYSPGYRAMIQRAKRGFTSRGGKGRQSFRNENKLAQKDPNKVDLLVTGDMLGSMQVKADGTTGAKMFLGSGEQARKASSLHARGFTGWFEYGDADAKAIDQALGLFIDDVLKKLVEVKKQ